MAGDLYVVHKDNGAPSMQEAAALLQVSVDQLDPEFGVQPIDPKVGEYAVLVKRSARDEKDPSSRGPFSNPAIGTFGKLQ